MATQKTSAYPSSFPNTSTSTIPFEVSAFYDAVLLDRVVANFEHQRWAQVRDLPMHAGSNVIKFRRYGNLSAASSALTEGVSPSGSNVNVTDLQATVAQYGDFILVSDVLTYQSKDKVLMEFAEILGDQAADTLDQLTRDVLAAGTSVAYSGTGNTARADVAAGDVIDLENIQDAVLTLANNKARKLTEMLNPKDAYDTKPLNACYVGIVSPHTAKVMKNITGFTRVENYSQSMAIMPNEIGALDEVRFIQTPNAKIFAGAGTGGIDVHATIILAANAYGVSRVTGETMRNIVKPLGSAGSADPLDQRATTGWKATFVAKILNDDFMTRIESAVA